MRHRRADRLVATTASVAVLGLLVAGAAAFLFLAVGPHVLGYRVQTVSAGGRAPGLRPGDVVVSRPVDARRLRAGDVISLRTPQPARDLETRQVTAVRLEPRGRVGLVTRGGPGPTGPPHTVALDGDTAWRATAVVPRLGSLVGPLDSAVARRYGVWLTLAGLLALGLRLARRDPGLSGATAPGRPRARPAAARPSR